ncbi:AAA family ATPase [Pseudomonas sp. 51_B]|uniref:AAA family ATPase n=1 Tax=Pseudomonas sp. 51_B TaxID=2813573 RepID=UPI001A9FF3AC|nr:AAA family ATPase [Pseudomonas sp. 51_B]
MGNVHAVAGFLVNTQKRYRFRLNGQNCIIIGKNGAGKTSLLTCIHERLKKLVSHEFTQDELRKDQIKSLIEQINLYPQYEENYRNQIQSTRNLRKQEFDKDPCLVRIHNGENLLEDYKSNKAVVRLYTAYRQAEIKAVTSAEAYKKTETRYFPDHKFGKEFEQHLVNMQVRLALATDRRSHIETKIKNWFDSFNENLQYLFEDESVRAVFNPDELRYYIHQQGKKPFTFQNLSSGYAAIFEIYSDLFIRAEYHRIIPTDLTGIVLIDEIDAHLHISLQRKILPFLYKSFPNIQFIVSTHSPFVITSTDDTIIFDISSNQVSKNLSMYSIEAIVEGLLGVPVISKNLEDKIGRLVELTSKESISDEAMILAKELSPFRGGMDSESEMHLEIAINKILKHKRGDI